MDLSTIKLHLKLVGLFYMKQLNSFSGMDDEFLRKFKMKAVPPSRGCRPLPMESKVALLSESGKCVAIDAYSFLWRTD